MLQESLRPNIKKGAMKKMKYNSFRPGKEWKDTNGKPIQAHGGSVIYIDGIFYWYGENKEKTKDTKKGRQHAGDLY